MLIPVSLLPVANLLDSTSLLRAMQPSGRNGHVQQQDYSRAINPNQQQDFSRGLNPSQLGSGDLSAYLQQQGLMQPSYSNPQLQSNSSLEALLRSTALAQQLQNSAAGLTQSASSNSLSGQYAEPQLRASASSGSLTMGNNSPPQLSSAHGSSQYLNQAHLAGLGNVDGQYGLGRRNNGSMSTGDLAALYEAAQVSKLPFTICTASVLAPGAASAVHACSCFMWVLASQILACLADACVPQMHL